MIRKLQWSLGLAGLVTGPMLAAPAHGELLAHWKFEGDAPFDDAVSRLNLSLESSDRTGKATFLVTPGKSALVTEGRASLLGKQMAGVDLRLQVNAPTRGGNPFRLAENSWTISGWLLHDETPPSKFGSAVAGTHGYSKLEGRGMAGWCLRAIAAADKKVTLEAVFSTGGEKPVEFKVTGKAPISTGKSAWHHFALTWNGAERRGRLFIDGKPAGEGTAPEGFDLAEADRNAFRGIWIAGRPTSEDGQGSDHWLGRLDDMKFFADEAADEAMVMAEFMPPKPEPPAPEPSAPEPPAPEPAMPVVAKEPEPAPEPVKPPPPPKPAEKVLEVRTWTDLRGKTMEAAMVVPAAPEEGRVLLQAEDGIRVSLPLEKLSEADGAYVAGNR